MRRVNTTQNDRREGLRPAVDKGEHAISLPLGDDGGKTGAGKRWRKQSEFTNCREGPDQERAKKNEDYLWSR